MKRNETDKYKNHYAGWQQKRIQKIEKAFGREFFQGKKILELACGYGDIGKYFREHLGAELTFAEGRIEHLPIIQDNNPGSKVFHLDQEYPWSFDSKFDVIIHFGVMYHLNNWEQDFKCALNMSDIIILESEIADSDEIIEFKFLDPDGYDQALNPEKIATRPSARYVEKIFEDNGFNFTRYDDEDLNDGIHCYNWKVQNTAHHGIYTRSMGVGQRRFWIAKKK